MISRIRDACLPLHNAALLTAIALSLIAAHHTIPNSRAAEPVAAPAHPRLLVLTDIGGDPDDQQSMIRLMLYANEVELEGLIATASGTPGELKQAVTKPQLIRDIVAAYGKVRDNLSRHTSGYPAADTLLQRVKSGNPQRGLDAIGEGHDTEGSRWIISVVDRADPRPVNITIWGGQTDFAQALWRVRHDRDEATLQAFIGKVRVYDIGDQDRIADWILKEFPKLFYILAKPEPGRDRREAVYRGMYLGGDESLTSRQWMETNIRQNHGPLGALYPTRTWTAPNPHSAMKEGDTPSWFYFLPTGLSDPAHPEWGCWGGRFQRERGSIFRDAKDSVSGTTDGRSTVSRWRKAFQHDFAARLDWCVAREFNQANHAPVATLNGNRTRDVLTLTAKPGETVSLSAAGSSDPDGDDIETRWWIYREAGTFTGDLALSARTGLTTTFKAPTEGKSETVHVILEIEDRGKPSLFGFRRAVIAVTP